MKIAILDQQHPRAIVCEVPQYLTDANYSSEAIAVAILETLNLPSDTEFMIGEFDIAIDVDSLNSGHGYGDNCRRLDEFTSFFKEEVLAKLTGHTHVFEWQGATTDGGEHIEHCTINNCEATRDSSGGVIG